MESTRQNAGNDAPKAKILVVDDDSTIRDLIREVLNDLGHSVSEAGDGDEALRLVQEVKPELILLDIRMPRVSGIEVCKKLRADGRARDIRIIMITGLDAPEALEESIIAGADDFLIKPISPLELGVRVRSMLMVRNVRDEGKRLQAYIKNMQSLRRAERH